MEYLWDDTDRVVYAIHEDGTQVFLRDFTPEENLAADEHAAQAVLDANRDALLAGLQAEIDKALLRQAEYQSVIDTPNSTINSSPASYIVKVARQGKRSERAIIRLARLVGDLVGTTDTGTD